MSKPVCKQQPAGAWFAQVGELHEVHHLWQYPDMATRKATREQAWNVGGWADTVQETVKLAKQMKSTILVSWMERGKVDCTGRKLIV